MKLLLLLILAGCTSVPIGELERQAMTCEPPGSDECLELHKRLEERLERRAEAEFQCPAGYVVYKDTWGEVSCVTQSELRSFLKRQIF